MSTPIKFGTDGWRGIIAQDFTFDNVRVCAQAVADYLKEAGLAERGLVIGYDTRFASEDFAAAAAEVVAANAVKVYLCPTASPTPVISLAVVTQKAGGAIVITASHNPANWNGFKFKTESGASASPEITARIEEKIIQTQKTGTVKRLPLAQAREQNLVCYLDPAPAYYQQMTKLVDLEAIRTSYLKVAIDSMYGAGAGYFQKLLGGGSIKLTEINGERNPLFPDIQQPEPVAANLGKLADTVSGERASVGLATDGDADRLGIVAENGAFISTLHVFALLCLYLLEIRGQRGPLVKTVTTTSMIYRLGELFDVPVRETRVGFKYVAPIMMAQKALIGGEESGGYGFRSHVPERDGILAGLYFLDLMLKTGKSPSQLIDYLHSKVGPHYYRRVDIKLGDRKKATSSSRLRDLFPGAIDGIKVVGSDTKDGLRFILADNSWLLIRFSQTEPLLRLYAESSTPERVEKLLKLAQGLVSA
jgi:alpha-D-glucose phosphate-specific phosphoglucomutase